MLSAAGSRLVASYRRNRPCMAAFCLSSSVETRMLYTGRRCLSGQLGYTTRAVINQVSVLPILTLSTPIIQAKRSQHTLADHPKPSQGPIALYDNLVISGKLRDDAHQRKSVAKLQTLYEELQQYNPPILQSLTKEMQNIRSRVGEDSGKDKIQSPDFAWIDKNTRSFFLKEPANQVIRGPNGMYIYGDVGTGKTMIMDLFYQSINITRKRRVHFHAFMQDIHKRIHRLRVHEGITSDPLPLIALELANTAWLLCFDEMQVTDIGDAMILRRLFFELFNRGVVMVTTSNRPPDDLYQNGIQRQSFLPAIDLLKSYCQVHSLNSGIDYRKADHHHYPVYFSPIDIETDDIVRRLFKEIRGSVEVDPKELSLWGRTLRIQEAAGRTAKVPFKQLCGEPLSAADYLELAKNFDVVLLTDVPAMTLSRRNEARRFITLIDALYENRVKLIVTMETELSDLFLDEPPSHTGGTITDAQRLLMDDLKLSNEQISSSIFTGAEEVFAFQRAISRLTEMQTYGWVGDDLAQILDRLVDRPRS
ncbi:hypothetical protein BASA50_007522 [Batrachochytrium salamandrivorans]|uniref:AAA+ ATPase domain-containing protein n=1 Tax=Batrachochytrium salamandrivorans TaxID=1357716 RepID=A0ABQ8F744_9FUNG|nr:hypothetical protein BASA50_007522 [Batrachochytrium salamandrivorans]